MSSSTNSQAMIQRLRKRVKELETAIRKHRRKTGHHLCWENDEELWSVLKDERQFDHTPPPWDEFIKRCVAYRKSREGK